MDYLCPVRRQKPEWEDTITNRMLHWDYSEAQKAELKAAMSEGIPKEQILRYFYPDIPAEQMARERTGKH